MNNDQSQSIWSTISQWMIFIFLLLLISWIPGIHSLPTPIKKSVEGISCSAAKQWIFSNSQLDSTNDASGKALRDFSNELFKIDQRYFTQLPSPCASNAGFVLPHIRNTGDNLLLSALFDLIRHGLAHQYQQLSINLTDGKNFFISLTGADYGRFLNLSRKPQKSSSHLRFYDDADGDLGLLVCPDLLFLDFEDAITNSGLLRRNLSFPYLTRSFRKKTNYYNFNLTSLENS